MKKRISILLTLILIFCACPVTAHAEESTVLTVNESWSDSAELSWSSGGTEYDGTLIEKSDDGESWIEYSTYYSGSADYFYVSGEAKKVIYYRVTCYNEIYNEETYSYDRIYAQPSNSVEVYSKINATYPYSEKTEDSIQLSWYLSKDYKKYVDGFEVFYSLNGCEEKSGGSVSASNYSSKNDYEFNYKLKIKISKQYAYGLKYIVKPYFNYNGKKYYVSDDGDYQSECFVSSDLVSMKTKRKKIVVKFKSVSGISKYKLKLTRYNLKSGKTSKTKTKTTAKLTYTIKTDTKKYGYYIQVAPVISGFKSEYGFYCDSHDAFTLMNSVGKSKKNTIKVVNTRGKKATTDWTYTLTKKDKKTIEKFFYKKYKGKNPSRAEMAYYALEWINKKVDYDYSYKYGGLRYVDAIFNKRKGQCLQYNGAFAAVLTYLGYEARVIEGYRMNSDGKPTINHFWCEVKLNGRWYLCETGNYGKNGYWQYFASLYRNSSGYAKFGKIAKDA